MSDSKKTVVVIGTGSSAMRALEQMAGETMPRQPIRDPIVMPAVLAGSHGRAWLCDQEAGLKQAGDYGGTWDGVKDASRTRVCELAARLLQAAGEVDRIINSAVKQVLTEIAIDELGKVMSLQRDMFSEGK